MCTFQEERQRHDGSGRVVPAQVSEARYGYDKSRERGIWQLGAMREYVLKGSFGEL